MSSRFNAESGLIVVRAELFGPSGSLVARLALDTGATGTMINVAILAAIGYDPSLQPERVQVTTGSGVEFVPRIPVSQLDALGQSRLDFAVLAHTLPPSAGIDGLLGLDFMRGLVLNVDFDAGQIDLS